MKKVLIAAVLLTATAFDAPLALGVHNENEQQRPASKPTLQELNPEASGGPITEITFEYRGGCWGGGVEYRVVLGRDGVATYDGVGFRRLEGKYIGRISEDDFQRLADLLVEYEFFEMKNIYTEDTRHLRGFIISAVRNKRRKTVEEHLMQGPTKLGAIETIIDRTMAKIDWVADTQ